MGQILSELPSSKIRKALEIIADRKDMISHLPDETDGYLKKDYEGLLFLLQNYLNLMLEIEESGDQSLIVDTTPFWAPVGVCAALILGEDPGGDVVNEKGEIIWKS